MADDKLVTRIKFDPCTKRKSLVGFVDFVYREKFTFTDVGVHEKLDKTGFRLVYPQTAYPIDHPMQKEIDFIISEHIRRQWSPASKDVKANQGARTNDNDKKQASPPA